MRVDREIWPAYGAVGPSPLGELEPVHFDVSVSDRGPAADVGSIRDDLLRLEVGAARPAALAIAIRRALELQLEADGHRRSSWRDADRVLHVDLLRGWIDVRNYRSSVAEIEARVRVYSSGSRILFFDEILVGVASSRRGALDSSAERALNAALADFIRGFAREPVLRDALAPASSERN